MCTLMALGSSGWVDGATVGRLAVTIEGIWSPEVDQTVFVASESVSTAARLPVRDTNAFDSTSRRRVLHSSIGMHGLECGSQTLIWCVCRVKIPERRRQSA